MRRRPYRKKRTWTLLMGLISVLLLIWMIFSVQPVLTTSLQFQTKQLATTLLNREVGRVLQNEAIRYDSLVTAVLDESGNMIALQTNAQAINQFKLAMTDGLNQAVRTLTDQTYQIRLGTLLNSTWLMGRGPALSFRLTPVGSVRSDLYSEFVSAGVNQTCHRIMLRVHIELAALMPMTSCRSQISTEFVIAETVIVGEVPRYFSGMTPEWQTFDIESEQLYNKT